jgi:hypothetical protein
LRWLKQFRGGLITAEEAARLAGPFSALRSGTANPIPRTQLYDDAVCSACLAPQGTISAPCRPGNLKAALMDQKRSSSNCERGKYE